MPNGRPINAFIEGVGPAAGRQAPMLNLTNGGMYGALPDYSTWVDAAPYVKNHGTFRLIRSPKVFKSIEDGNIYREFLKTLLEIKAKRWEGIDLNVDVSYSETDLDGSGNIMHTPSDSKRAVSEFSVMWDELQGSPIGLYWKKFCSMFLIDPIVKRALITSQTDLPDYLPDMFTFAGMAYETDATNRFVIKAMLIDNMAPKNNGGGLSLSMDKNAEMESVEVTVPFTGFTLDTQSVLEGAQALHDEVSRTLIDPNRSKSYIEGVEADIASIAKGYKESLDAISQ